MRLFFVEIFLPVPFKVFLTLKIYFAGLADFRVASVRR